MQEAPFVRLGKFIFHHRRIIIILWLILVLACLPFIPYIVTPFKATGFTDPTSESSKVDAILDKKIHYNKERILITYTSKTLKATQTKFINKIKNSLKDLDELSLPHDIYYPNENDKQISKDKHTAYVLITFNTEQQLPNKTIQEIQKLIKKPSNMEMNLGGEPIFIDSLNKQTQKDLYKSDLIAAPISIITLLLVFGTVVSALIPILIGGAAALLILTTLYFLGQGFVLSIFTLNIALLLGLCLTLDYCLFMISRFRDELAKKLPVRKAIAVTVATAGRAVFYSGLAVFISLSALLMFPINVLFSVGIGGLVAVFVAVILAVFLLPAILAVLNHRVNAIPVIKVGKRDTYFWRWLATKVVKHPLIYFLLVLALLLTLGYPFYQAKFGVSDYHILPPHAEGRQFFKVYQDKFDEEELTPIVLWVTASKAPILSYKNLKKLSRFVDKLEDHPGISKVYSIVNTNKKLNAQNYYQLYHLKDKPKKIKNLLKTTTTKKSTLVTVVSKYPSNSIKTTNLINDINDMKPGKNLSFQITGTPVNNKEVLTKIKHLFPYAILWIIVLTYLILLLLLRSVFLPLKAILMNVISLSASYGVLVFIFQEGHFHELLNFEPQGMLDISLLIIIFCALFGFSMDYEVFLLTRIKECYEKYHNNNKSIIFGIDQSAKIITSAAIIVIFLCGSFMFADVLMVKEFGLGIAVAIFVDAFLVRSLLVPATMALVKQINWYCPRWLKRILPNDNFH